MESVLNSLGLKMGLKLPSAVSSNRYNLKHAVIKKNTYITSNNYMEDLMKIGIVFVLLSAFSMLSAQTYCAGDQVSIAHQNISHEVCAGVEGYPTGSEFKLADYNGELNGGSYHIIFIDMSASW
jgi:hypothetical protein